MSNRKLNPKNGRNHISGRIGFVMGLVGSFSLVLMQDGGNLLSFILGLALAVAGYVAYIVTGE